MSKTKDKTQKNKVRKDKTRFVSVLLHPPKGDPQGLLREGPLGARPPMAWLSKTSERKHEECLDCDPCFELHREGYSHCTVCEEEWPCSQVGKVEVPASKQWKPCEGCPPEKERWRPCGGCRGDAIVLAWEGQVIEGGCTWLTMRYPSRMFSTLYVDVVFMLKEQTDFSSLRAVGEVVLLDANGKEVFGD
jgi:hypothetical protein